MQGKFDDLLLFIFFIYKVWSRPREKKNPLKKILQKITKNLYEKFKKKGKKKILCALSKLLNLTKSQRPRMMHWQNSDSDHR
ncbi:hypothetical protein EDC94DRAFT_67838 [Helicostylum pulchrum]|nr:hypothetical protein EDC94DRAFT_67838 [Helicostylum pulchrum]